MLLSHDENFVRLTGNIVNVDVKNGQHGPFGTIRIALDDSYYDKKNNNQRVERTHFVNCKLSDSFFKKVASPTKGDRISIEGKLILEEWGEAPNKRSELKVKVLRVISHTSKAERSQLRELGFYGKPNQQQQGGHQQAPQQGGYQQAPQQGGYQQAPQQGGFNQTPQQGGYQQ